MFSVLINFKSIGPTGCKNRKKYSICAIRPKLSFGIRDQNVEFITHLIKQVPVVFHHVRIVLNEDYRLFGVILAALHFLTLSSHARSHTLRFTEPSNLTVSPLTDDWRQSFIFIRISASRVVSCCGKSSYLNTQEYRDAPGYEDAADWQGEIRVKVGLIETSHGLKLSE